ncbi:high affinity cationic amino acid transporter 1-like [Dendronephthya gigantea]|uniref:high affinity cationic amino acid transporter 1-like n=1 Tax=Dendronephthya gigantea TaxID=151771 RepID=UPI00106BC4C3|nr:high affinity cationic amino acid transporter 1-like [Dendronephthya gigantea]
MNKLCKAFFRTKHLTTAEIEETNLKRCLSTFDLTALGIGCTLGAGVYVVTGEVAKNQAGPAIVISFAIAAIASLLSGLCYAEFGARVPKCGSAYIYSYVTIGELCAFVIGWNMLLEYVMGAAALGKAWSDFFNALCDGCVSDFFIKHFGLFKLWWMSDYPDFLAFSFLLVLTIVIICGAAESSALNWVFTIINLAVIIFATIAGLVYADPKNWNNFAPWGFHGIMSGAATCFFAFVGFDVIATSGEECKNPRKAIPRATVSALFIIFLAYECISVSLTLMMPYADLPKSSAIATAFDHKGFSAGKYIVAIGAICGISSSALDGLFPIPRIIYAMASDRLIFSFLGKVNKRTGTPIIACVISGLFPAFLAMFLDLVALAEMLSIGTLLSYTIVSFSVLLLRYRPGKVIDDSGSESAQINESMPGPEFSEGAGMEKEFGEASKLSDNEESEKSTTDKKDYQTLENISTKKDLKNSPSVFSRITKRILGGRLDVPTEDSYLVVKISLAIFIVTTIGLQCCLVWGMDRLTGKDPLIIVCFVLFLMWMLIAVDIIARQPQSKNKLFFKVPFLPFLPLCAIFINAFLLLELHYLTWVRFGVWLVIGMMIYLSYGVKHSTQNVDVTNNDGPEYMKLTNTIEE